MIGVTLADDDRVVHVAKRAGKLRVEAGRRGNRTSGERQADTGDPGRQQRPPVDDQWRVPPSGRIGAAAPSVMTIGTIDPSDA